MAASGIHQWNDAYPNRAAFLKDLEREELYVYQNGENIIGSITITSIQDEEYRTVKWLTPAGKNRYIHRLAVHPDHQGKGYAQKLMAFAESLARASGAISIRLDTFSQNQRNQDFYEKRGYTRLGPVYFPKQSPHPFYCYELEL